MICTSIQNKNYREILEILDRGDVEMAEIRIELCQLSDEELEDLFANSDTPLVATCRIAGSKSAAEAERKLLIAAEAGARFLDLEIEAPAGMSRKIQKECQRLGTELIRSYHNYELTPDDEGLQMALARCFRYGADIAKVVTACHSSEDAARLESLYSVILEGVDSMQGHLIAFGMGEAGRESRMDCLRRGAPFTYAALSPEEATAPGQWTASDMYSRLYGNLRPYNRNSVQMPASKSFAQRAIVAAALAEGTSHLSGFTSCGDSDSAIRVAEALGAKVERDADMLSITGIGPIVGGLGLDCLHTGESGLLTRLMIPVLSAVNGQSVTVTGEKTLTSRPLKEAGAIMASFGVVLSNAEKRDGKEIYVPVNIRGKLIPGNAEINGSGGSQLISGLLMALPLCAKDSFIFVNEPKSIPYMYITLDVLRHFGINTRSEMEGDAEMLEQQDWSACSGISFKLRGGQSYRAADFAIEGDWSAAANFLVAGAIAGSVEVSGLDTGSLQADISILDILVQAGASVSQTEDGLVCVRKAPLEAFNTDLSNAPDIFPIVAVLAALSSGESRIAGVGRLLGKESNRAEAIITMLNQMGVEASIEEDVMVIPGESLTGRILGGRLLRGGCYTTRHDHRMLMALRVAELVADSPITVDDEECVSKSFPEFGSIFN